MDRMMRILTLALGLVTFTPLVAYAGGNGHGRHRANHSHHHGRPDRMGFDHRYRPSGSGAVPELDPGTAGAALALLAGGSVLALGERRRRRPST
jgi:hypothetical protein